MTNRYLVLSGHDLLIDFLGVAPSAQQFLLRVVDAPLQLHIARNGRGEACVQ